MPPLLGVLGAINTVSTVVDTVKTVAEGVNQIKDIDPKAIMGTCSQPKSEDGEGDPNSV